MPQSIIYALETPRVFHTRENSSLADAGEQISRLAADDFRSASAFAFISESKIIFDADAARPLLQYAAGKPAILLTPGKSWSIEVDQISENGFVQLDSAAAISKVREADLLQLLHEDGGACALEPHSNYHYVTPSLTHTSQFMRIGDLLRDLGTLDRFAYWLRPHIGNAQAILVDSWSIASPILRTLQISKLDTPFDCLPEHPTHNGVACRRVVEGLISKLHSGGKLVAFVSISGSGRLVKQISAMVSEHGAGKFHFECLSIYGFTDTPEAINCFARVPSRGSFDQDSCDLCLNGSVAVPIDPSAYHLKSLREPKVLLLKDHMKFSRPFLERYSDTTGLFLVHHDDRNDGRHHAFDLDTLKLVSHPEFLDRFYKRLEGLSNQVDLVIAPNHEVGRKMADLVGSRFGCSLVISDTLERDGMGAEDVRAVTNARMLLIVDDAVNSGSRLKRYVQSIREGRYGTFTSINYLVAVARPHNPQIRSAIDKSLTAGHGWGGAFHAVEDILLPSWDEECCPWCAEFDFLSRIARGLSRPPQWLSQRLAKLRNRSDGITDEPIFLLPGVTSVALGDQSPLCPGGTSSMVTMFALASALQSHRNDADPEKQLHPGFPVGNVLSPENVITRYTEGLIRAALLRLVHRAEWGQVSGAVTRDFLLSELENQNQRILAGELLFALGRASLPPVPGGVLNSAFDGLLLDDQSLILSAIGAI